MTLLKHLLEGQEVPFWELCTLSEVREQRTSDKPNRLQSLTCGDRIQFMRANALNYIAGLVFLAAAIRDWFVPGVFQISTHHASSDESVVWLIMGCTCIVTGLVHSRRAKKPI